MVMAVIVVVMVVVFMGVIMPLNLNLAFTASACCTHNPRILS
jgi:hypothetical protein